jgi:hypothetical protein
MVPTHSLDALTLAHVRGSQLQAQAAAERRRGTSPRRHALVASLRRVADHLDPSPLARWPASLS